MRTSFLPVALLFCALLVSPGCSEDGPVTPNPIDTTDHTDSTDTTHNPIDTLGPCQTPADPRVLKNGFVLEGSGFPDVVFNFDSDSASVNYTTLFGPEGTIYQLTGPVYLSGDQRAVVKMTIEYPTISTVKGYPWEPADTVSPSGIRIEIGLNGATSVLLPTIGETRLITAKIDSVSGRGSFCGFLKDSVSGALFALKSGKFFID